MAEELWVSPRRQLTPSEASAQEGFYFTDSVGFHALSSIEVVVSFEMQRRAEGAANIVSVVVVIFVALGGSVSIRP